MSLNRIIKRRAFKESQPSAFSYWAAHRRGEVTEPRKTYHEYAVSAGDRHPTFQKKVKTARAEHGLRPTSTDMCRVHGRRIG